MAVKARAEITLSSIRDIQSVTRYYLLQSSTAAKPNKPTTNPPGGSWVKAEPTYTTGSTNSLYFTDCTVFSDGTFVYSDVSLSSSYEAAKVAYNKAENAETIAEKAKHAINLTPFGSRKLTDSRYWLDGLYRGVSSGVVHTAEQLEDGWIHVTVDPTGYTGTNNYIDDRVRVAVSPSVKANSLYTIFYEVRNNKSTVVNNNTNSCFYIQPVSSCQFWGLSIVESLEGKATAVLYLKDAITTNGVYRHRFTQLADSGTHAGSNPTALFRMMFRADVRDVLDYEVRVSLYEDRYLGDYMPYVISDTTDIEADISAANALAQSAKDTADGKITTFYAASDDIPTATTVGDLWIKTDDGNSLWRWNGTSWVSVDNADIQSALTAAGTAQATADSKVVTFAQTSTPTATDIGDIWIDTDDSNHLYRWDGEDWVDVHDPQIDAANEKIDNLEIGGRNLLRNSEHYIPNSGIFNGSNANLYNQTTLDGEGLYYASGSKYVKVTFPNLTIGEQYAFSCEVARQSGGTSTPVYITINGEEAVKVGTATAAVWTKFNVIFTATSSTTYAKVQVNAPSGSAGWVAHFRRFKLEWGNRATDWTPAPEDLDEAITAAQETANGKNTVYYQAEAPSGGTYKVNDIWFDTGNGNKMYMWNGSAWTPEEFGNAAISDLSITNAKIADGTIENAKIANLDAGKVTTGTMSAARIKGDELTLGGEDDTDGVMKVYDAEGNLVGSFTKEGLMAIAGMIGGWTIKSGKLMSEWNDGNWINWTSSLEPDFGLTFEQESNEPGLNGAAVSFYNKVNFQTDGTYFSRRRVIGDEIKNASAFITSDVRGDIDTSEYEGTVIISPHLTVDGTGIDSPYAYFDQLHLKTLENGLYIRQPQLIMKGSIVVKNGSTNKNVVLCTIPTAYQDGYYIIPFASRTYGLATGVPDDAGDFKYAYYNHVNYTINLKLFNNLTSGVWYEFVYFIYALPKT